MQLKKKKGMTVIELLIASLILSIVFMGYTALQIRSIFDTEFANRSNIASFMMSDIVAIMGLNSFSKKTIEEQQSIYGNYIDSFNKKAYNIEINQCNSAINISDNNYCTSEMMIDYQVKKFKEALSNNIPEVKTAFISTSNPNIFNLIISWNGTEPTELSALTKTETCIMREVVL